MQSHYMYFVGTTFGHKQVQAFLQKTFNASRWSAEASLSKSLSLKLDLGLLITLLTFVFSMLKITRGLKIFPEIDLRSSISHVLTYEIQHSSNEHISKPLLKLIL